MAGFQNAQYTPNKGQKIVRWIFYAPAVYVVGSYLYWPVLKVIGVLFVGDFHFMDHVLIVHGEAPFWSVVLFSPLTLLYHLLTSVLIGYCTVDFVYEYVHGVPEPPHAFLIIFSSLLISFAGAACMVGGVSALFRRMWARKK